MSVPFIGSVCEGVCNSSSNNSSSSSSPSVRVCACVCVCTPYCCSFLWPLFLLHITVHMRKEAPKRGEQEREGLKKNMQIEDERKEMAEVNRF